MELSKQFVLYKRIFLDYKDNQYILIHDNIDEYEVISTKNFLKSNFKIDSKIKRVSKNEFNQIIRNVYEDIDIDETNREDDSFYYKNIEDLAQDAPAINLLNEIIRESINKRATDVHIESTNNKAIIRVRIGLNLEKYKDISKSLFDKLSIRIKYLSRLNINEKRLPQDGKTTLKFGDEDVELRISTLPTKDGESIVLRVLKQNKKGVGLQNLGFSNDAIDKINQVIQSPHGMILCVGPTGSGKTTTLHSVISKLNDGNRKIITIEDPIEYKLTGINQIQVNNNINLTFSSLLRKILRHDPDIIMVGEMRDDETSKLAFSASLTGHLVLSTLHTNSCAATFKRIKDLNIENYMVESSIRLIISQRIIKKICPKCRRKIDLPKEFIKLLKNSNYNKDFYNAHIYEPHGCEFCNNTGYDGLTIVYEILEYNNYIKENIDFDFPEYKIQEILIKSGMNPLLYNGINKIFSGEVYYKEFIKLVGIL